MENSPILDAQNKLLDSIPFQSLESEKCGLSSAAGRTLAEDLLAPEDYPPYPRAIVEGFIVHTADTQSASEENPVSFVIVGEIKPGDSSVPEFSKGEALRVSTGSLVTAGEISAVRPWDAKIDADSFTITRPFPPRFFLEDQGSEIGKGSTLIKQGQVMTAAEIGRAASLGLTTLQIKRKPKVAIFASGSEVIPFDQAPAIGQIRDCNSIMLKTAVEAQAAIAESQGIMPDDLNEFKAKLKSAIAHNDMCIISGGTAVNGQNFISDLVAAVGELIIDGVPAKSGRPLIMGHSQGKPIICVAGHPPEALRGFRLFAQPVLQKMLGQEVTLPSD